VLSAVLFEMAIMLQAATVAALNEFGH